jgi:hypothetical protein
VFGALTLHAAGRSNTALASLLDLLADHVHIEELERYKPAMRGNAEFLSSLVTAEPSPLTARARIVVAGVQVASGSADRAEPT